MLLINTGVIAKVSVIDYLSIFKQPQELLTELKNPTWLWWFLVLSLSQTLLLPYLLQKTMLNSKVVKSDLKIFMSLHYYKSVTLSVPKS